MTQQTHKHAQWGAWLHHQRVSLDELHDLYKVVRGDFMPMGGFIDGVSINDGHDFGNEVFSRVSNEGVVHVYRPGQGYDDALVLGSDDTNDFRHYLQTIPGNTLPRDRDLDEAA